MGRTHTSSNIHSLAWVLLLAGLAMALLSILHLDIPPFNRMQFLSSIQTNSHSTDLLAAPLDSAKKVLDEHATKGGVMMESNDRLNAFFQAIQNLQDSGGTIHIAYFGDSMIEGDLLTAEFRKKMQALFGGSGVGYVPITSAVAGFRNTIRHQFNDLWQEINFTARNANHQQLYGPCGHIFTAQEGAEATFKATHFPFYHSQLIWNNTGQGEIAVQWDENPSFTVTLAPDSLSTPVINIGNQKAKQLTLRCHKGQPQLLGLNFENGDGVYVDNFAFRGSTGTSLSLLSPSLMQGIDDSLHYRLVIIQYGLNVIGANVTDYSNYQKSMERTIDHLQKCFPKAAILLVGMTDKGINENGNWVSDPAVPFLLNHQIQMAEKKSLAFFSLYHAMGGEGSMLAWVNDSLPKLANKDYTHPNFQGANILADSLFYYLKRSFEFYEEKYPKDKTKKTK